MTTIEASAKYSHSTSALVAPTTLTLTGTVREVTGADAPVAVRVPQNVVFRAPAGAATADIRTLDGEFYIQQYGYGSDPVPLTSESHDPNVEMNLHYGMYSTEQEAREALLERIDGVILIDGFFWNRITEPALVVDPNGMSIIVQSTLTCSPWRLYSLAEEEEAVEAARRLRRTNGMTAEPHPSALNPGIELLMPEVITMASNAERMEAVRAEAVTRASAAVALLEDFTPRNIHEASRILAQVAEDLNVQTTGSSWNGGNR